MRGTKTHSQCISDTEKKNIYFANAWFRESYKVHVGHRKTYNKYDGDTDYPAQSAYVIPQAYTEYMMDGTDLHRVQTSHRKTYT